MGLIKHEETSTGKDCILKNANEKIQSFDVLKKVEHSTISKDIDENDSKACDPGFRSKRKSHQQGNHFTRPNSKSGRAHDFDKVGHYPTLDHDDLNPRSSIRNRDLRSGLSTGHEIYPNSSKSFMK